MSVVLVTESWKERKGNKTKDYKKNFTRAFYVEVDSASTTEDEILDHDDIPKINASHPGSPLALCDSVDCSLREESRLHWLVTCSYTIPESGAEVIDSDDPTDQPAQIDYDSVAYTEPAENAYNSVDDDGNPTTPIVNSAGDPFVPPAERPYENTLIRIRRNEKRSEFKPIYLTTYRGTVNIVTIKIAGVLIPAYHGMMRKFTAGKAWDTYGHLYWQCSYEIEVKREAWRLLIRDQGFNTDNSVGNKQDPAYKQEIRINNRKCTEAQPLDGHGHLLFPQPVGPGGAYIMVPVYLPFYIYLEADWAPLKLPANETKDV